jgi:hypothetical protein
MRSTLFVLTINTGIVDTTTIFVMTLLKTIILIMTLLIKLNMGHIMYDALLITSINATLSFTNGVSEANVVK